MAVPLLWQVLERPATSTIAVLCTAVWLWLSQKQLGYPEVGLNYQRFVQDRQFWRIVTSQFSHVDFIHLLFNMASLWSIGFYENGAQNSIVYLQQSLWLLVGTGLICLAIYAIAIELLHKEAYRHHLIVGYSGVIFGWMALLSARGMAQFSIFGVLELPMSLAPFGALVITSIIVPRVSFIGHLSGILMGYFMAFVMYPITTNSYCSLVLMLLLLAGVGWSLQEHIGLSDLKLESLSIPCLNFYSFRQPHHTDDIETGADVALLHDHDTSQASQH